MKSDSLIRRSSITEYTIQFCRYLRKKKFVIGTTEELDILKTLSFNTPSSIRVFQEICKVSCARNVREWKDFDFHFQTYWQELGLAENSKLKKSLDHKSNSNKRKSTRVPDLKDLKKWLYAGRVDAESEIVTYSSFEVLTKKDFSSFAEIDYNAIIEILRLMAFRLSQNTRRRFEHSSRSEIVDMGNTIRQAMKREGSLDYMLFKQKKKTRQNIILLCDVSKSMDLYSRFLIEFMYGFHQASRRIHTFVFSTSLTHISRELTESNITRTLHLLSEKVENWSGGTRIGHSFNQFRQRFASKFLDRQTVVIILSDGWDTGDKTLLKKSMSFIHRKCGKVIWLNPLAGAPNFSPEVMGMVTAMPYVDVFASAHNIETLKNIAFLLRKSIRNPFDKKYATF